MFNCDAEQYCCKMPLTSVKYCTDFYQDTSCDTARGGNSEDPPARGGNSETRAFDAISRNEAIISKLSTFYLDTSCDTARGGNSEAPLARGGNSETRALGRNINLKCSKMWNVSCHCPGTDIVGS